MLTVEELCNKQGYLILGNTEELPIGYIFPPLSVIKEGLFLSRFECPFIVVEKSTREEFYIQARKLIENPIDTFHNFFFYKCVTD